MKTPCEECLREWKEHCLSSIAQNIQELKNEGEEAVEEGERGVREKAGVEGVERGTWVVEKGVVMEWRVEDGLGRQVEMALATRNTRVALVVKKAGRDSGEVGRVMRDWERKRVAEE